MPSFSRFHQSGLHSSVSLHHFDQSFVRATKFAMDAASTSRHADPLPRVQDPRSRIISATRSTFRNNSPAAPPPGRFRGLFRERPSSLVQCPEPVIVSTARPHTRCVKT